MTHTIKHLVWMLGIYIPSNVSQVSVGYADGRYVSALKVNGRTYGLLLDQTVTSSSCIAYMEIDVTNITLNSWDWSSSDVVYGCNLDPRSTAWYTMGQAVDPTTKPQGALI